MLTALHESLTTHFEMLQKLKNRYGLNKPHPHPSSNTSFENLNETGFLHSPKLASDTSKSNQGRYLKSYKILYIVVHLNRRIHTTSQGILSCYFTDREPVKKALKNAVAPSQSQIRKVTNRPHLQVYFFFLNKGIFTPLILT